MQEAAHIAVDEIQKDLLGRKGFRQTWDSIDDDIRQEITQMMYNHIMEAFQSAIKDNL
jgi:hypothetical protein